ncbi:hypothetical protein MNBD_GAMMA15-2319 [hydrothermal vent metagenome]|uniref:Glycosyltransferase 2-like domain-containing protein n=1 Tax=hydrothermal vent metagenome TaxID=652676 RepID=A0A3B0YAL1_9ZZZZ
MKVMIGIPAARGALCNDTVTTVFHMQQYFYSINVAVQFVCVAQAEIVTARNVLAQLFLDSDCDLFIGLDDDVAVELNLVIKLVSLQLNFIGCYLPQRNLNLKSFAENIRTGMTDLDAQLSASPLVGPVTDEQGVFEVNEIGTGFYIVRKSLLTELIKKQLVVAQACTLPSFKKSIFGFFNNIIGEDGGITSEDYSFCKRIKQANYAVFAYKGPGISHTGLMTFSS